MVSQKSPDFQRNQEIFLQFHHFLLVLIFGVFILTQTRPIPENFAGVPASWLGTPAFFVWILHRLSDEAAHPLGGVLLHLPGDVGVGVQGEPCAVVAQDAGYGFGVYALLDGQRCEGVPQAVERDVLGDPSLFQQVLV